MLLKEIGKIPCSNVGMTDPGYSSRLYQVIIRYYFFLMNKERLGNSREEGNTISELAFSLFLLHDRAVNTRRDYTVQGRHAFQMIKWVVVKRKLRIRGAGWLD